MAKRKLNTLPVGHYTGELFPCSCGGRTKGHFPVQGPGFALCVINLQKTKPPPPRQPLKRYVRRP